MLYRRFDWHEHIKDVEGEYRAARFAVDQLRATLAQAPDLLKKDDEARAYLRYADDSTPEPMTITNARARLQTYLSWLPEEWA